MMEEYEGFPDGAAGMAEALKELRGKSAAWAEKRAAMKMDFLMRGICGAEVDGLVEERAPLPPSLLWERSRFSGEKLAEALRHLGKPETGPEWIPFLPLLAERIDQE